MRNGTTSDFASLWASVALLVMSIASVPQSARGEKIKVMTYGFSGCGVTKNVTLTQAKSTAAREAKHNVPQAIQYACYQEVALKGHAFLKYEDFSVVDFTVNDVLYYLADKSNLSTVIAELKDKLEPVPLNLMESDERASFDRYGIKTWVYALADAEGVCTYQAPSDNEEPSSKSTARESHKGDSTPSTDVVSSAIDKIRNETHSAIPSAESIVPDDPRDSGVSIENATGHTLTVYFGGRASRTITIAPGDSAIARLPEGRYEMAAEVPNSAIQPFYGRHVQQADTQYRFRFFVDSR